MIELKRDQLKVIFPEVHAEAKVSIEFQRTLRIPDDGKTYPLPPGLGRFPVRHVDDFAAGVSETWLRRGGVVLPMFQSEAMWLNFNVPLVRERNTSYPFAIKVAAGKINAATGEAWDDGLDRNPQNYMVSTRQRWLDGYCVEKGLIRQFVAMPLGSGYSAEEQITGEAEHGGVQVEVFPMKREVFERRFPKMKARPMSRIMGASFFEGDFCIGEVFETRSMALAPGGKMRQEIYADPFDIDDWDLEHSSRCFVHIANSMVWRMITGKNPPGPPPTADHYTRAGLPWFDYYSDAPALEGSGKLNKLKSVATLGKEKGDVPLPENMPVTPEKVVVLREGLGSLEVRDGKF